MDTMSTLWILQTYIDLILSLASMKMQFTIDLKHLSDKCRFHYDDIVTDLAKRVFKLMFLTWSYSWEFSFRL